MKVGVTGHQEIGSELIVAWLRAALINEIGRYHVTHGVSCLARGSDQLFAGILTDLNIPFTAIVPSAEYESTFDYNGIFSYQRLLNAADEIVHMQFNSPSETAFYEAGKAVVRLSDMIFAIWDGQKARGLGGTADIVRFATEQKKTIIHFNPIDQGIFRI